jgi:hypothetical protein
MKFTGERRKRFDERQPEEREKNDLGKTSDTL